MSKTSPQCVCAFWWRNFHIVALLAWASWKKYRTIPKILPSSLKFMSIYKLGLISTSNGFSINRTWSKTWHLVIKKSLFSIQISAALGKELDFLFYSDLLMICCHFYVSVTRHFKTLSKKSPNYLKNHRFLVIFTLINPSGYNKTSTSASVIRCALDVFL